MSTYVTTDLQHAVEDAAAHLYVWALKDIPQDLRDALARNGRLLRPRGREGVAQVLRDVLQRPDVEVRRGILDRVL